MQFVSLEPLDEGRPTVVILTNGVSYDLHNDAILERVEVEFEARVMRLRWKAKTPAWQTPDKPEPSDRRAAAGLSLSLSGVRSVRIAGELLPAGSAPASGLDFMEYYRMPAGVGELRLVFDNDSEIVVQASRCELLTTAAH
jgi:hypothetical protein